MRVLHCADFHFDAYHRERAIRILQSLAKLEYSLGAEVVLIAGDIFESMRAPKEFIDEVSEGFRAFRTPIIAIPGNHDIPFNEHDATSRLFSQIKGKAIYLSSVDGQTIETADGRLRVWGRGMLEHSPENDPLANLEEMVSDGLWNVVLAHGELLTPGKLAGCSSPIRLESCGPKLANVDYVALGHTHNPYQILYSGTILRYPGAATTLMGTGTATLVDFSSTEGISISSYSVEQQ